MLTAQQIKIESAYDYLRHHRVSVDTLAELLGDMPMLKYESISDILSKSSTKTQDKLVVIGSRIHQLIQDYIHPENKYKKSKIRPELRYALRRLYKVYRQLHVSLLGKFYYSEYVWHNSRGTGVADGAIERFIRELDETSGSYR